MTVEQKLERDDICQKLEKLMTRVRDLQEEIEVDYEANEFCKAELEMQLALERMRS